jgi:hypothetical protein
VCGWFGEKERYTDFSGGIATALCVKKKWIWLFALTFVSFGQANENKKMIPIVIGATIFVHELNNS